MNKRKKSKLGLIVFIGLSIYFSYTLIHQEALIEQKNGEMKNVQIKVEEQKKINDELKKQKDSINSDEYVEEVAREKLGMVRHGEKVFVDVNK